MPSMRTTGGDCARPFVDQRAPVRHPGIDVGLVVFPNPGFDNVAQSHHYILEGSHPLFDCHVHETTVVGVQ